MVGSVGGFSGIDPAQIEQMRAKLQELQQARFNEADGNGDGVLDASELEAAKASGPRAGQGPDASEIISKLDSDGDGGLSIEELQARFDQLSSDTRASLVDFQAVGFQQPSDAGSANTLATQLQDLYEKLLGAVDGDEEQGEDEVETVDVSQTL